MQAHWDHTAALAEIKETVGAEMWATAGDAPVLEDGGFSDPHFGGRESFRPVAVASTGSSRRERCWSWAARG